MTNLLQQTVFGRFTELPSRSNQQISSKILKGAQFFRVDIGALVLLETEGEEPPVALIGCDECSRSATLAPASKPDPFLDDSAAQVASISPRIISSTAWHSARSDSPTLRAQRPKWRVLNTLFMRKVCH